MKEQYNLTKKEELMELMWENNKPLTSVEMLELYKKNPCKNHTYIYRMINSLLKKKLIKVCGTVQYKTQYARQIIQYLNFRILLLYNYEININYKLSLI